MSNEARARLVGGPADGAIITFPEDQPPPMVTAPNGLETREGGFTFPTAAEETTAYRPVLGDGGAYAQDEHGAYLYKPQT